MKTTNSIQSNENRNRVINYDIEIVRDFDGTYYVNARNELHEHIKGLPEYLPYKELKKAVKEALGVTLPTLKSLTFEGNGRKQYANAYGLQGIEIHQEPLAFGLQDKVTLGSFGESRPYAIGCTVTGYRWDSEAREFLYILQGEDGKQYTDFARNIIPDNGNDPKGGHEATLEQAGEITDTQTAHEEQKRTFGQAFDAAYYRDVLASLTDKKKVFHFGIPADTVRVEVKRECEGYFRISMKRGESSDVEYFREYIDWETILSTDRAARLLADYRADHHRAHQFKLGDLVRVNDERWGQVNGHTGRIVRVVLHNRLVGSYYEVEFVGDLPKFDNGDPMKANNFEPLDIEPVEEVTDGDYYSEYQKLSHQEARPQVWLEKATDEERETYYRACVKLERMVGDGLPLVIRADSADLTVNPWNALEKRVKTARVFHLGDRVRMKNGDHEVTGIVNGIRCNTGSLSLGGWCTHYNIRYDEQYQYTTGYGTVTGCGNISPECIELIERARFCPEPASEWLQPGEKVAHYLDYGDGTGDWLTGCVTGYDMDDDNEGVTVIYGEYRTQLKDIVKYQPEMDGKAA